MKMNEIIKRDSVRVMPIVPKDYEEVFKMAGLMAKTDMVPKDFVGKQEKIVVAIQLGLEVGLLPMQALQNIAVINGRPCIWGDAQIALVRGSGHLEWMKEQQGDDYATCEVKRFGEPNVVKQTFRKVDAERAGLWGKVGPWKQYPKRMLQMRARSFALRDLFPDVLKGIQSREEVQDIIDIEAKPPEKKESFDVTSTKLEKDNLDALKDDPGPEPETTQEPEADPPADAVGIADASAEPPPMEDDLPIDEVKGDELISQEEFSDFLAKSRDLKITTKKLVAFVKKNGFDDASQITKEKYALMLAGLVEVAK
jgi:hypothetical protein